MQLMISDDWTEVQEYLAQSKAIIYFDIETTALTVGHGQMLCVAFAPLDRDDVMVWWPSAPGEIKKLRLLRGAAHNSPFDQRWLESYGARVRVVWDTMFMAYLLDENRTIGLDDLGKRLLGYGKEEIDVTQFGAMFGKHWEDRVKIPRKTWNANKLEVSKYVGKDVHVGRELLKWQKKYLRKNLRPGENPVYVMQQIMLPAVKPLQMMEANRMPVRMPLVKKTKQRVMDEIAAIEAQLDKSVPDKERWPDFLKKSKVNWGNTNWTKWWLYVHQGAKCPAVGKPSKTWPDGVPSLSAENLGKIDHPAARLLIKRSTLYKQLTGFLVPIEERTRDGRIGTSFKLTGTVTGRLSSSSPSDEDPGLNSQQIPRDKSTRNLFGERGRAWIEVDFGQLELRVAAVMAGDRTMLDLFERDEDIHTFMAMKLVQGKEMTKEHRSLAKGVNFGFIYGMREKHFADYVFENYGVTINPKDAGKFRAEFFETFSSLEDWYRRQRREAIEYGGVHNEFGRFRHLPKVYDGDYWVQENAFRQAINSPVQSTGSDFMLISLAKLARDPRMSLYDAQLITTVHDSVCLTAPYKYARKVGRIVKQTLEAADDGLKRKFFLKADVTISRCWGGEPLAEF
ncbi:DNA polymerase I [Microbacterium phage Den3]|uniref:DNA polymerase I n=5 Tax=Ilzatvirus teagan TaxID=2845595 RepID=A0A516KQR3_9CAUD|nr:DNA polymerase I [Microbacterium phage Greys]QDM56713.1 DNA polymerase I [Microbacterium phage Velene]QDP44029.1 DNA polymerase I [Microbacterium phage Den3]QIN93971.1 DNA polymerase I [Microbacterium phage Oxtober96]QKO02605.1 DNA polymerase I [Microbacterium phage Lovelyunicorn]